MNPVGANGFFRSEQQMRGVGTKLAAGVILSLIGGGVILYGASLAIVPLVGMYQGALEHPLDDPKGGERGVSDQMLHGVKIGAIGVLPMIAGSVLLKAGAFQLLRRKRE